MFPVLGEYVTWTFSPNNNGIAPQGRAGCFTHVWQGVLCMPRVAKVCVVAVLLVVQCYCSSRLRAVWLLVWHSNAVYTCHAMQCMKVHFLAQC
jgi:hypothetical protein